MQNEKKVTQIPHDKKSLSQVGMDRRIERSWFERYRKQGALGAAVILASLLLVWFWPEGGRSLKVDGGRVVISAVTTGRFDDFIPVRGRVTPLRTIYLDAIEGGRVERVVVEDGAFVEAGELLVELSNTSLQLDVISRAAQVTEQLNNLRTLELALERNRLEHKRNLVEIDYQLTRLGRLVERRQGLVERGNAPRADLEDAEDELQYYKNRHQVTLESQRTDARLQKVQIRQLRDAGAQLEANLEFARHNLDSLNVRAPASGKLTALNAEIGQSLSRGERLGQIDDPEGFKIKAEIDEFYLGRVDLEQTADLSVGGQPYQLRVAKIYPQVRNGQFEVDLEFGDNAPAGVRRGQTLQMRLFLGDASEAVLIRNGAFYQDTGGDWVFVVSDDGTTAIRRRVRLGRRNMRFIEVLDGLEPGESVITSPYTNFLDMDRLELQPE